MTKRQPPEKFSGVVGILEPKLDPFDRALVVAEIDDEPVTEGELRDIEASRQWFQFNERTPFKQVIAERGLTVEEVVTSPTPTAWVSHPCYAGKELEVNPVPPLSPRRSSVAGP